MKVKELVNVIFDEVVLYIKDDDENYPDIYKGMTTNIPTNMLEMEVQSIVAIRKRKIYLYVK